MKKIIYTILSLLSVVYIAFLTVAVIKDETAWNPNFGAFESWFNLIVRFGGVAIIFAFALVNFTGSPLKTAFFIILILVIVCYIIVMAVPDFVYNLFGGNSSGNIAQIITKL